MFTTGSSSSEKAISPVLTAFCEPSCSRRVDLPGAHSNRAIRESPLYERSQLIANTPALRTETLKILDSSGKLNSRDDYMRSKITGRCPIYPNSSHPESQKCYYVRFWEWDCFAKFIRMKQISSNLFVNCNLFAACSPPRAITGVSDY